MTCWSLLRGTGQPASASAPSVDVAEVASEVRRREWCCCTPRVSSDVCWFIVITLHGCNRCITYIYTSNLDLTSPDGQRTTGTRKKGIFHQLDPQSNYHKALDAGESPTTIIDMARGALFHQSDGNNELRLPWQQAFTMTVHALPLGRAWAPDMGATILS